MCCLNAEAFCLVFNGVICFGIEQRGLVAAAHSHPASAMSLDLKLVHVLFGDVVVLQAALVVEHLANLDLVLEASLLCFIQFDQFIRLVDFLAHTLTDLLAIPYLQGDLFAYLVGLAEQLVFEVHFLLFRHLRRGCVL